MRIVHRERGATGTVTSIYFVTWAGWYSDRLRDYERSKSSKLANVPCRFSQSSFTPLSTAVGYASLHAIVNRLEGNVSEFVEVEATGSLLRKGVFALTKETFEQFEHAHSTSRRRLGRAIARY